MISKLLRHIVCLLTLVSASLSTAKAAEADTVISLVNIYPGPDIYELEGHTLLHVSLPACDVAVSYGTYDFSRPNFVYHFVKGETDYTVSASPWQPVLNLYMSEGRRIVSHRLNLTSDEKKRLVELLADNLRPENRIYRYNYVKDNCATRPLRMVELAAGDTIILGQPDEALRGNHTFRSIMRHYHRNYPWYQFGIDLALGSGIDYRLDNREQAFAPALLDSQIAEATVGGKRLSDKQEVLCDVEADAAVMNPTPLWLSPLFCALCLLATAVCISIRDLRRRKVSRWYDALLFLIFGLAGCLLAFLTFISVHEATSPNLLLLWLNPLCLVPTIFIWINRCRLIVFSYQIVNFVAMTALLLLVLCGQQTINPAFYPLIAADAIRAATYIYLYVNRLKCPAQP